MPKIAVILLCILFIFSLVYRLYGFCLYHAFSFQCSSFLTFFTCFIYQLLTSLNLKTLKTFCWGDQSRFVLVKFLCIFVDGLVSPSFCGFVGVLLCQCFVHRSIGILSLSDYLLVIAVYYFLHYKTQSKWLEKKTNSHL